MAPRFEYCVTDSALLALEQALAQAVTPAERLDALLTLAWQLRQRDTHRALGMAEQVERLLLDSAWPPERSAYEARLLLLRGEGHCLHGELDAAAALGEQALQACQCSDDADGSADARSLLAAVALAKGDVALHRQLLELNVGNAAALDDLRVCMAEGDLAGATVLHNARAAQQRWGARFDGRTSDRHPAEALWSAYFLGLSSGLSGQYGASMRYFGKAYGAALQLGLLRAAVQIACNVGVALNYLNDHASALEWMQRGLQLARQTGWSPSIAAACIQAASSLRALQHYDSARELLKEAMALSANAPVSRQSAIAMNTLGGVELACAEAAAALQTFQALEQAARALGQSDLLCDAWLGQARAWRLLGQAEPALAVAQRALEAHHAAGQIEVLRVMAELHALQAQGAGLARQALERALALAGSIEGYAVPGELLDALAEVHATAGESDRAYAYAREAGMAYERLHSQEAANRAIAMQVAQETERARQEHEQLRLQTRQEQLRAESLQQLHGTLEQLGDIGREITAHLDSTAVFEALERNVAELLDAATFIVFRLDPGGQTLSMVYGVEDGIKLAPRQFALHDPQRNVPRCARERSEIAIEDDPPGALVFAGTRHTPSKLYAPLLAGERLLGVLTVQSFERHAYGERERAIFRSLSAYGAIALANADAMQTLREAQAQVAQQERLAALGQLVANVAHEINTPMAVVKSSGQNIADALAHTLSRLPGLLWNLDEASKRLFFLLVAQARHSAALLSSREERALARQLTQQLQAFGVAEARSSAELLLRLHAHVRLQELLPLLRHPRAQDLLAVADDLATLVRSSANINTAVERMAKIAFALQRFSPGPAAEAWQEIELRHSLDAVLRSYQGQLRQGIELVLDLEDGLRLRCLPDELGQVWTNLIHNALQAMQNKGRLSISARRVDALLRVSVTDDGCGIPEAIQGRIFDAFFTTKASGEGSGLGLDIVQKIVAKHGGSIALRSAPGQGATFAVSLPLQGPGRPA